MNAATPHEDLTTNEIMCLRASVLAQVTAGARPSPLVFGLLGLLPDLTPDETPEPEEIHTVSQWGQLKADLAAARRTAENFAATHQDFKAHTTADDHKHRRQVLEALGLINMLPEGPPDWDVVLGEVKRAAAERVEALRAIETADSGID